MAKAQNRGLKRLWHATLYSLAGLKAAWQNEEAFRQECAMAVVLLPAAFWVGQTPVQRAALVGSVIIVLVVELLNSAIEAVVDRVSTDRHDLSGRAKDMGSAAVLLSVALLAVVWGTVIWSRWLA